MEKIETDYSNTIIYKITCNDPNIHDVYVGHTTNFVQRKKAHRLNSINSNSSGYNCKVYKVIRNNGGWDNWNMTIVGFYDCKDIYEARQKEQEHFVALKANLNSVEPLPQKKLTQVTLNNNGNEKDNTNLDNKHKQSPSLDENSSNLTPNTFHHVCGNNHKSLTNHKIKSFINHTSIDASIFSSDMNNIKSERPITDDVIVENDKIIISKDIFTRILKDYQEIIKKINSLEPNTNNTKTPIYTIVKKSFNIKSFLINKCNHAMIMGDFVNSIHLDMNDLENIVEIGYVKGMSNILIRNLQNIDVYKRPVHCGDIKRHTLYVNDNNHWDRDNFNHQKMVNAVIALEKKIVSLIDYWVKEHPNCMNSHTRDNETYLKLLNTTTHDEQKIKIYKVIKKVAQKVTINKILEQKIKIYKVIKKVANKVTDNKILEQITSNNNEENKEIVESIENEESIESIENVENEENKKSPFYCEKCDFRCCKQSNFNTHLSTHKHKKIMGDNQNECQPSSIASFNCGDCNKKYSHLSGLCRHRKTCVAVKQ